MGLLDSILGNIAGSSGSPVAGMVGNLLESQGGIQGLMGSFERAGLGGVVQSWIGGGPNQPIAPDQLRSVLGEGPLQDLAQKFGLAPDELLQHLSQHLPGVVDQMTPGGAAPGGGSFWTGDAPAAGGSGGESTGWGDVTNS